MTRFEIYANLKKNDKDNVLQTIDNCVYVLEHDEMLVGAVRFNMLTERECIVRDVGWTRTGDAITEKDMSYLKLYFERNYHLNSEKHLRDALCVVANENRFHPIQDYLNALKWDGQERIRKILSKYLGTAENDILDEAYMRLFLLGAISRVFEPGVKFDLMLCLVGGQGAGKSSFFRLLTVRDEWFSDDLKKIDDENVYRKMKGHWIIEMSEMLATVNARSIEDVRSFLSRTKETYKVPYDIHPEDRLRQCVFAGTSNSLDFLPLDRAGNRRFMPIMVHPEIAETHILKNEAESRAYIDQLWAEAMVIYRSGNFVLKLDPELEELAVQRQKEFMPEDTDAARIRAYLDSYKGKYVCSLQLYEEALGYADKPSRASIRNINDIMNNCMTDWVKVGQQRIPGYNGQRAWGRKTEVEKEKNAPSEDSPVITGEQTSLPEGW